jgi:hypothetical protein
VGDRASGPQLLLTQPDIFSLPYSNNSFTTFPIVINKRFIRIGFDWNVFLPPTASSPTFYPRPEVVERGEPNLLSKALPSKPPVLMGTKGG